MAELTEREIKSCWRENMLGAADDCNLLMALPAQGVTYARLRDRLGLAEGACRQMCQWREDARWLYLAPRLEILRDMAMHMINQRQPRVLYKQLGQTLRQIVAFCDDLENKATGRMGMIVPEPQALIRTESRPVQVIEPAAARPKLILPDAA